MKSANTSTNRLLLQFLLIVSTFILSVFTSFASAEISSSSYPRVRTVYIVPSDKVYNPIYEDGIKRAVMHLQDFYLKEMGNGKTFFSNSPIVEVFKSQHSSLVFSNTMWSTAIDEAKKNFNATWNDPLNRWLLFVDADVACDGEGIGGTQGFAVLGANDLRGLSGEKQIYNCERDKNVPQFTPGRWVGGLGHELGHSWLLPHPSECDPIMTDQCPAKTLMYLGYQTYPETFLLESNKVILNNSSFFTNKPITDSVFNYFEKQFPNYFIDHSISYNENEFYTRKYKNGAMLSEEDGYLFYKLNSSDTLRSYIDPIEIIFDTKIKSLNGISDDSLTKPIVKKNLSYLGSSCPTSITEGSSGNCNASAYYTDGTNENVTSRVIWAENSNDASISSTGTLTTKAVTSDQSMTVTASYSYNGVSKNSSKVVIIKDTAKTSAVQFGNKWKTGQVLTINGNSKWLIISIFATNAVNICEAAALSKCLNIETGSLQSSTIQSGWWSAQWMLESTDMGYVRIRNRWKTDQYIHWENTSPMAGKIQMGWWSAQWKKQ
ncbi:MAG: hypothetical protein WBP46_08435 [Thiolinea sp.]